MPETKPGARSKRGQQHMRNGCGAGSVIPLHLHHCSRHLIAAHHVPAEMAAMIAALVFGEARMANRSTAFPMLPALFWRWKACPPPKRQSDMP